MFNAYKQVRSFRSAVTLVELLVVIAIIGVLVALLLPAIQAARESARCSQCQNNSKQIGLALQNFEGAWRHFPPGSVNGPFPAAGVITTTKHGWVVFLLPYLEEQVLYDLYLWDADGGGGSDSAGARTVQLKLLQCPSAESDRTLDWQNPKTEVWLRNNACTDYAAILSVDSVLAELGLIDPVLNYRGVLSLNSMTRVADITDGTSHTILIAEAAGRPTLWQGGKEAGSSNCGPWPQWRNCQIAISGTTPPSYTSPGPCAINCTNNNEIYSFHPGGANVLFADGTVHLLIASIDIRVLAGLVTRDGGEVVSADDY
jgi:prepilin-type N-terminal cleavage/methylation domain-containing protein/prepilin-type processing-associated H-X9-DG protein